MRKTLITGFLLILSFSAHGENSNPASTAQFFSEVGIGYLVGGGGFLSGCMLGGIIVPRTDKHMSAAWPAALTGYGLGVGSGVFLYGEAKHVRSSNAMEAYLASIAASTLPVILGYLSEDFTLFTVGLVVAPLSSAAIYNITKVPKEAAEKELSFSFSITLF